MKERLQSLPEAQETTEDPGLWQKIKGIAIKIKKKISSLLGFNDEDSTVKPQKDVSKTTEASISPYGKEKTAANYSEIFKEILTTGQISVGLGHDITEFKAEGLVSAANTELKNISGVARALESKGGLKVVEECKTFIEKNSHLDLGEVVVTNPGKLSQNGAKKILHAAVIKLGEKALPANVTKATVAAIKKASEHNLKSLALPAFGTGVGGLSPEESASAMFKGIQEVAPLIKEKGMKFLLFYMTLILKGIKPFKKLLKDYLTSWPTGNNRANCFFFKDKISSYLFRKLVLSLHHRFNPPNARRTSLFFFDFEAA